MFVFLWQAKRVFHWDGDPDLYEIALAACARAHVNAKQEQEYKWKQQQQKYNALDGPPPQTAAGVRSDKSIAYISFDDTAVMNKLHTSTWVARYGILKLVPLCVFTN